MRILILTTCLLATVLAELQSNIGYPDSHPAQVNLNNDHSYRHDLSIELKKRIRTKGVAFTRSSTISDEYRPPSLKLNPSQQYGVVNPKPYYAPSTLNAPQPEYGLPPSPPGRQYLPPSSGAVPNQDYGAPSDKSLNRDYGPPSQEYGPPARQTHQNEYGDPNNRNSAPNTQYGVPPRNAISGHNIGVLTGNSAPLNRDYLPPSRNGPNQEYGVPALNNLPNLDYGVPASVNTVPDEYGVPTERNEAPSQQYGPPASRNEALSQQYGPPASKNAIPSQEYGTPALRNALPTNDYGVPVRNALPDQAYGTPALRNTGPHQEYGPPALRNAIPSQQYGVPAYNPDQKYGVPAYNPDQKYGVPAYNPDQKYGVPSTKGSVPTNDYLPPTRGPTIKQYGLPNPRKLPSQEYGTPPEAGRNAASNQEYGVPAPKTLPNQEYGAPNIRNEGLNKKYGSTIAKIDPGHGIVVGDSSLTQSYGGPVARISGIDQDYTAPSKNAYSNSGTIYRNLPQYLSFRQDYGASQSKPNRKTVTQEYSYLTGSAEENNAEVKYDNLYSAPQKHSDLDIHRKSNIIAKSYNPIDAFGMQLKTKTTVRTLPSIVKPKNEGYKTNSAIEGILENDTNYANYKVSNTKGKAFWRVNQGIDKGSPYSKSPEVGLDILKNYDKSKVGLGFRSYGAGANSVSDFGNHGSEEPGYVYAKNSLDELRQEPANYNFAYQVNDYSSGSNYGHTENRINNKADGMYYVVLPDGNKQVVEYVADERGYKPKITVQQAELARSGYDVNAGDI